MGFVQVENRTFTEKNIPKQYIYQWDPSCLRDTVTSFFHRIIQDKETRPTICRFTQLLLGKSGKKMRRFSAPRWHALSTSRRLRVAG